MADGARSSQTDETASELKQLLSAEELAELQDGGEIDTRLITGLQGQRRSISDSPCDRSSNGCPRC